jgi:hypothetical protein
VKELVEEDFVRQEPADAEQPWAPQAPWGVRNRSGEKPMRNIPRPDADQLPSAVALQSVPT